MRTSSDRRRRDRELQRAAANRRVGHDHAYLILFGGWIPYALALLLLVAAGAWVWFNVDRSTIAGVVGAAGVLTLAVYLAWAVRTGGLTNRMLAMAKGTPRRGHWHLVGASGALMVMSAVMIWTQLP